LVLEVIHGRTARTWWTQAYISFPLKTIYSQGSHIQYAPKCRKVRPQSLKTRLFTRAIAQLLTGVKDQAIPATMSEGLFSNKQQNSAMQTPANPMLRRQLCNPSRSLITPVPDSSNPLPHSRRYRQQLPCLSALSLLKLFCCIVHLLLDLPWTPCFAPRPDKTN
jgi:hypothetical protein